MKHLLLLPAMLLVSAISIAQLYVAPNDNGTSGDPTDDSDSFIYVNDQYIFVEDDVNLSENTVDADKRASIYLRNNAQLIQGGSNGLNSGSGYLSIYRENPDSDRWDTGFFASPVGDVISPSSTPGAGNTNFGILSLHTPIYNPLASDYSAPLSVTDADQTLTTTNREGGTFDPATNELEISTRWVHTRGVGSTAPWIRFREATAVPAGQGFIMKGVSRIGTPGNHDFVYDFRGRPNNGTISFNTIPVTGSDMEQVLTGNPYPSALDLNRLFYDTQEGDAPGTDNLENSEIESFLFWDEDRTIDSHFYVDNKGGFATYIPGPSDPDGTSPGSAVQAPFLNYDSAGNPTTPTGDMGANYVRRFAPVGQGFYFQTINTQTGDMSTNEVFIKNQYRRFIREAPGTSVFRTPGNGGTAWSDPGTDPDPTTTTAGLSSLRIYTYFENSHFRDLLLNFHATSTDYYDRGLDARHPMDAVFADAYFPVEVAPNEDPNEQGTIDQFVIQTVPFAIEKMVPYAITLDRQTSIVVEVVQEDNFTAEAFLFDTENNSYQQITGGYTASLLLNAGEYEDRFYIVFKGGPYVVDPPLDDEYRMTDGRSAQSQADILAEVKQNVRFFQNNTLGQLEVSNPETYNIKYAHMFDMTGKLVQTQTNIGKTPSFTMNTATLADGVYLIKLATDENVSVDYKALVHNKR